MRPLQAKFRDEIPVTGGWCDTRQFSLFKSQRFCNSQLLYGKKSRESQQNEFIYINLQFFNIAIQWLNTIMFRFILYRLIIKRAYVFIGYI